MQRVLARLEQRLAGAGSSSGQADQEIPVLVFRKGGSVVRGGPPLPYYPKAADSAEPPASQFAAADALEFRENRYAEAIRALRPMAESKDPALRAACLMRMARIFRKAGDAAASLESYRRLAELGPAAVGGLPAGLVGRQGAALLSEETGQAGQLRQEAELLARDLEQGRWILTRATYDLQLEQLHRWLPERKEASGQAARKALAKAAEVAWTRWRESPEGALPQRMTLMEEQRPVLVLARATPEQLTLMLAGAGFLESSWLEESRRAGARSSVEFALSDAEGRRVLGRTDAPLANQSVRTAASTGLPWTVHAISVVDGSTSWLPGRSRLLLTAVLMMVVLVLGAGYLARRAISRELSVSRLQADFVASVSHEFRTPLTTMRQLSEMLVQGRVSSEERRAQFFSILLRESDRLHRLVDGLLQFGQMEAGQMPVRFEPVDPARLVEEVAGEFRDVAGQSGHQLIVETGGALPAVRGDREALGRVLWNLLDNAVKYSPGTPTVWVEARAEGGDVAIRVRDRGVGIPPAEQERIFSKFVRGVASKEAAIPGTGVGLAMARQIVEAHGGRITVESELGEGSVFAVVLPAGE
ncbi:MAG: HAMP domain-containing histidine kinase [Acidobacteria bacterium]|nr:HAMP domain-containing histidine kinase [Acidobacteriota bacterium]